MNPSGYPQDASAEAGLDGYNELVIDCSQCPNRGVNNCDDCLVSFIIDRSPGAIVFDAAEERALRELSRAGMLPEPKLKRLSG